MADMASQRAWDQIATDEAEALASDDRCVLVVVIGADSDELGTTHLCHGVAGPTKGSHLRQFIVGVERKLDWLKAKLVRRA